ncbi:MAG: response regulator transcription factor [Candidatus Kaiserbacteria bacterium]|nr:response regulator transcription factor [Candidatus Kaiserbacteria bacterium]
MRILVVEDETRLARNLRKGLSEDGFAVDLAPDGEEGQFLAENEQYDAIILDLMLPKVDGLTICRTLRAQGKKTPILMLTARANLEDKVMGLDSGADDYLTKPFAFAELRSRLRALIRRSQQEALPILRVGDLEVDPLSHTVRRGQRAITLTPKEFAVLEILVSHKGHAVSRTTIQEHAWDYNFESMSNVVDVFIRSIRAKIDAEGEPRLIQTVHGIGYKISNEA